MDSTQLIEYIEHKAIVLRTDPKARTVTVSISDADECGDCPAAKICAAAASTDKITIPTPDAAKYAPGDAVIIRGSEMMHRKAILIATVIPCICLICVMVALFIITGSQITSALAGLASMFFFFAILYLFRNKIAHEFRFTIQKSSQS